MTTIELIAVNERKALRVCVFFSCSILYHQFLTLSDDAIIQLLIFEFSDPRPNSQVEIPLFRTEEGRYLASSKLLLSLMFNGEAASELRL